jgi:cyclopropane fatty-acyl-phospholipid synthase-like methyltransferase
MANPATEILADVASYYSAKLAAHGETPLGVDWNGAEGQNLRFEQLAKIIRHASGFSLADLGCGYGALLDYLHVRYGQFEYYGYDVSADMVRAAERRQAGIADARFIATAEPVATVDYAIASGIFNVRLGHSEGAWHDYFEATVGTLDRTARSGFAFNCLTSYSDPDKQRSDLYYADPAAVFDLCKRRYSRHVALLHDYGLYEFTVLVRKTL